MTDPERRALCSFMLNVLEEMFPDHKEYPFRKLKGIELYEGDESEKFNDYPKHMLRAYWIKRSIEIIEGNEIWK